MTNRFPIICYFNEETTSQLQALQNDLFKLTGSRACLDLWKPHLTVGAGVEVPEEKTEVFYKQLQEVVTRTKPFTLKLREFGYMDDWMAGELSGYQPYVIYVGVKVNDELLSLVEELTEVTDKYHAYYKMLQQYAPHVTIAFKDLDKEGFEKARGYLSEKSFSITSGIDHIAIAKENEKGLWTEFKRFKFGG